MSFAKRAWGSTDMYYRLYAGRSSVSASNRAHVPYFRYFGPTAIVPGFKQMVWLILEHIISTLVFSHWSRLLRFEAREKVILQGHQVGSFSTLCGCWSSLGQIEPISAY